MSDPRPGPKPMSGANVPDTADLPDFEAPPTEEEE